MGRKPKTPAAEAIKEKLPSPIPASQQSSLTETKLTEIPADQPSVPMPRASQFPCPRCGQPMKQNGKSGMDLYYYCRGFGPVIACGFPGKTFTTRERHEHELKQDLGRAAWIFHEQEGRYEFAIEER